MCWHAWVTVILSNMSLCFLSFLPVAPRSAAKSLSFPFNFPSLFLYFCFSTAVCFPLISAPSIFQISMFAVIFVSPAAYTCVHLSPDCQRLRHWETLKKTPIMDEGWVIFFSRNKREQELFYFILVYNLFIIQNPSMFKLEIKIYCIERGEETLQEAREQHQMK